VGLVASSTHRTHVIVMSPGSGGRSLRQCTMNPAMLMLAETAIQHALENLEPGLRQYEWLQANVLQRNVATDVVFQTKFDAFYRVRRASNWRKVYFELLERAKTTRIDFATALQAIQHSTNRMEASFASKLVAMIHPSQPVIDKFVLQRFDLGLPTYGVVKRTE